jgi:hypothetical protein
MKRHSPPHISTGRRLVLFLEQHLAEVTKGKCRREHTAGGRGALSCELLTKTIRLVVPSRVKRLVGIQPHHKCELLECDRIRLERSVPFVAHDEKEMDDKNTGLAAGNNFLLARSARDSTHLIAQLPSRYLAINWQRDESQAPVTCRDHRFPTPSPQRRNNREIRALVTTNHVFWPNERRRISSLLPNSQPKSTFLSRKCTERAEGGGGVSQTQVAESSVSISSHRNFVPNGTLSLPYPTLLLPKKPRRNRRNLDQSGTLLSRELAAKHR